MRIPKEGFSSRLWLKSRSALTIIDAHHGSSFEHLELCLQMDLFSGSLAVKALFAMFNGLVQVGPVGT